MTVPSAPSVGGLCLFLGGGEGGPWGSGVQCPGLNPQLCISLAAWSWVSQPSVLIVSSPVKWIDYFLSHRIVLKIKCVKNSWHTGNIINCWFLLSLTQHFVAQATASLQTANLPLSSLTSLRLWSVWLVRKLHSFFRTCSFRDSSPRPRWCPLYHTCLLFEAPGLSAQLRWEKVDGEDGPASCFQGPSNVLAALLTLGFSTRIVLHVLPEAWFPLPLRAVVPSSILLLRELPCLYVSESS